MREWQSQAHVNHYCRYHIVFVPKYRRKSLYGTLRKDIGKVFRDLCHQTGVELIEGYAMRVHIHKETEEKREEQIRLEGLSSYHPLCGWLLIFCL